MISTALYKISYTCIIQKKGKNIIKYFLLFNQCITFIHIIKKEDSYNSGNTCNTDIIRVIENNAVPKALYKRILKLRNYRKGMSVQMFYSQIIENTLKFINPNQLCPDHYLCQGQNML
jgi:hypothetical protein